MLESSYNRVREGILGDLLHEISIQIVVESSSGYSNGLVTDKKRLFALIHTLLNQIQADCDCRKSSDTLMGFFCRAVK